MKLFTKSEKIKVAPQTEESKVGSAWLQDLLKQDIKHPVQQIAGMTGTEQGIQDTLAGNVGTMNDSYNLAMQELMKTLQGGYDPATSDYYQGFRNEANAMKDDQASSIRRRSQLGGMLASTPSAGIEAENNRRVDNLTLQELGKLTENERNRTTNAALGVGQVSGQQMNNLQGAESLAAVPRAITQAEYDAMYTANMNDLLAPYQLQAPIASNLLNYKRDSYMTGGGLNDLGMGISLASGLVSAFKPA